MKGNQKNIFFEHAKFIIEPNIHQFLYVLTKYLILGKNTNIKTKEKYNKLISIIKKLKIDGLDEDIFDNIDNTNNNNNKCNIKNLLAIFNFIKKQNYLLASEIFENILIKVLNFALRMKKEEFFGKYLYNGLEPLIADNNVFETWIKNGSIKQESIKPLFNKDNKDLIYALVYDYKLINSDGENNELENYKKCKESTFLQILYYIFQNKKIIYQKEEKKSDSNSKSSILKKDTSIYSFYSNYFYDIEINKKRKDKPLPLSKSILISSYIYHQNNQSPLIKYSEPKNNLEILPFTFELSEAGISDTYSSSILSPVRIEPRISGIELNNNIVQNNGIIELHKTLMFNKNIKIISIKNCGTKSVSLNTFNDNFNEFNNYNIKELNLSSNYLNSDADTNLSKLISHLKELKILNLSYNNLLKSGLGFFFVTLKNLYRKNQSKLEILYLNNCLLDDISFYELGELLKSKYCKLKCLCLNENRIPSNINFFKALKKNESLEEIYFYGCKINSEKTDEIERIINNTNLQKLYLNSNIIHDFNQYIRILYRTTLVKNNNIKRENIFINNPTLFNLNMNSNVCYNQNAEKINLLFELIKNTNLSSLDLSSVIINSNNEKNKTNFHYYFAYNEIIEYLDNEKEKYKKAQIEINYYEEDINNSNNKLNDKDKKDFEIFDKNISEIINDNNSRKDGSIKEKAKKLISSSTLSEKEIEDKENKLIAYIKLKKAEKKLNINKKFKEFEKMIII